MPTRTQRRCRGKIGQGAHAAGRGPWREAVEPAPGRNLQRMQTLRSRTIGRHHRHGEAFCEPSKRSPVSLASPNRQSRQPAPGPAKTPGLDCQADARPWIEIRETRDARRGDRITVSLPPRCPQFFHNVCGIAAPSLPRLRIKAEDAPARGGPRRYWVRPAALQRPRRRRRRARGPRQTDGGIPCFALGRISSTRS